MINKRLLNENYGTFSRRTFLQASAAGGAGALVVSQLDCGGASVEGEVLIAQGAISALSVLFPGNAILSKVGKLFSDFNADWVAGKFDSARTLFDNLDVLTSQVIGDLGVNASTRVKLLLAALGIALRAIAALIKGQATPALAAKARTIAPSTVDRVSALANDAAASQLLAVSRP